MGGITDMARVRYTRPDSLELTKDAEANRLIAQDPVAFLIGWILDQQIRVQQAFAGPLELRRRIGTLDAATIAAMPLDRLVEAFVEPPVLHRYGRSMATRVHACMTFVTERYAGDAERVWLDAEGYEDLRRRLLELPGFGPTKAPAVAAMLARRFGLDVSGFEDGLPPYGSLSDVERYEDLVTYQARKREHKAAQRAAT